MENLELDELVYTYPPYDIAGIQTLISAKEEFREIAPTVRESVPKRGELFRHQKVIKRLLLQYDNLLLTWQTGVGKACGYIGVTEYYKNLVGALEEIRKTTEQQIKAPYSSSRKDEPGRSLSPPYKQAVILVKG